MRIVLCNRAAGIIDVAEVGSDSSISRLVSFHSVPDHLKQHLIFRDPSKKVVPMHGPARQLNFPTAVLESSLEGLGGGGKRSRLDESDPSDNEAVCSRRRKVGGGV